MEIINRKQEIASYVIGMPSVLASRREIILPRLNSGRRSSLKPPKLKKTMPIVKSPTWPCLGDELSPRSKNILQAKMTLLPFLYAQSKSGSSTPLLEMNLPLTRRDQEVFHNKPEENQDNCTLLRRNTCTN